MLSPWPERWKRQEPPPDCAALLTPAEGAPCETTKRALLRLQEAARHPSPELLEPAAELALSAERAVDALRRSGLAALLTGREESDAAAAPSASIHEPSARPRAAGPPASVSGSSEPWESHSHNDSARKHDNPALGALVAYSRLSNLALRQISAYLEHGPIRVRTRALGTLTRLGAEQPRWAGLEAIAQQAHLLESDPALREGLAELTGQLRKNRRRL